MDTFTRLLACRKCTTIFCRAFDLLNSSNPVASGYKAPLRPSTFESQRGAMEAAARELMGLMLESGRPVVQDGRRMSVISLAFTLKSISLLAEMVFDSELECAPLCGFPSTSNRKPAGTGALRRTFRKNVSSPGSLKRTSSRRLLPSK